MLRLILAVSQDGFLAKGPADDMRWTSKDDKRMFRALTSVGGVLGAGSRTFDQLPKLPGRRVIRLTSSPRAEDAPVGRAGALEMTLGRFCHAHPDAWLIGGPTIAREALELGMVGEVFMCRQIGTYLGEGMPDLVTPYVEGRRGGEGGRGRPWGRQVVYSKDCLEVVRWAA
jgi:dihydrofolate reductase